VTGKEIDLDFQNRPEMKMKMKVKMMSFIQVSS